MVTNKYHLWRDGFIWLAIAGALGFYVFLFPNVLDPSQSFDFPGGDTLVLLLWVGGPLLLGLLLCLRAWRQEVVNQRRQAVAEGVAVAVPLAAAPSAPNEGSFQLPFTITLKRSRPISFLLYSLAGVGSLAVWPSTSWAQTPSQSLAFFLIRFTASVLLWGLYGCTIIEIVKQTPRIEVTFYGLTVFQDRPGMGIFSAQARQVIGWDDARLFAICDQGQPGTPGTRYELSGAKNFVEWRYLRRRHWWSLYRPPANYAQQMETLLAYVAARTGLPLYDVR